MKEKTIPDISRESYDKKTFPDLYAQEDFNAIGILYVKDEIINVYQYDYSIVMEYIKKNLLNTQKKIFIQNAPLT